MKLRWSNQQIKGFSSPIKKAEAVNDWIIWLILVIISLSGIVYLILEVN